MRSTTDQESRPISALLSQALVAYTVEFDNEFERAMASAGFRGARLSLSVWNGLLRFVGEGGVLVKDLSSRAGLTMAWARFQLGCLERWQFISFGQDDRDGFGNGRGIRADWMVQLTPMGVVAAENWPPLFGVIDDRWRQRFGDRHLGRLITALRGITGVQAGLAESLALALRRVAEEFNPQSPLPIELCANTIRALGEEPVAVSELARLTGVAPESCAIGWQVKPYVSIEPLAGGGRGKAVKLNARGLLVRQMYQAFAASIEKRWACGELRELLEALFPKIGEGLAPPAGVVRAGGDAPALGRRMMAAAALQRRRDIVAQNRNFVRDPAGCLPHYPMWDMNRGFGP
jgi:hypothetical protein